VADVPYRLWSDRAEEAAPPTHLIVAKLKPTTAHPKRVAFGVRAPATGTAGRSTAVSRARGLVTIEVARGENARQMARHLASLGGEIEYAYVPPPRRVFAKRPRRKTSRKAAPDPFLSRQWGHNAVRLAQARAAAGFADAADIVVAVADSGVDKSHPDLKGVIREYKNFVKGEGARDYVGHGTHVTGIIAAAINNGIGVSGLCAAKILALKVLGGHVEWDAPAYYRALGYGIGRARVLNLSLGNEEFDPGEKDLIADLIDAGIVVVAAMGNEFEKGNPTEYPAALEGVCAVGATDQADRRGSFSNTGPHISISAPGVSVFSTTPTYTYKNGATDYDSWDGTSMAAPYVSAAAALVLEKDPTLTPAQVIKKLQQKAAKVPGMKKRPNTSYGWGRLDIAAALR
jgi:subtilisin family serine protease